MNLNSACPNGLRTRRRLLPPFLALLLTAGCDRAGSPVAGVGAPPVSIAWVAVKSHGLTATEDVAGTVRARLHSVVEAKVAGQIESLLVAPGQAVKQGETLAVLDAREARARLESAQAVLDQANRDFDRVARMVKEGAATPSDFDAIQARRRMGIAGVSEAETTLAHARIVAPFGGVIARKLAEVGDLATPGRPLFEIEDPAHLRFEADVPEALIDWLQPGLKLAVRLPSVKAAMEGVVVELAPVADAVSRTYLVKLDLPGATGLRAGQFGRVAVPTGEFTALHVPTSAIVQRGQLEFVFVPTNGVAQLRLIRTGRRFGDETEVVSGLDAGERVVSAGAPNLHDGQRVEARP